MSRKQTGRIGLSMAINYFTIKGYTVSLPINDTLWYDLIVEKDPSVVMSKFLKQLERDQKLKEYCKTIGVSLLEVKYDIKDIEQYLRLHEVI